MKATVRILDTKTSNLISATGHRGKLWSTFKSINMRLETPMGEMEGDIVTISLNPAIQARIIFEI